MWEKKLSSEPGYFFRKLYKQRSSALEHSKKSKDKPESKVRRWKRKCHGVVESTKKKARMEYGPEALDSVADVTSEELDRKTADFLQKHINLTEEKLVAMERCTRQQSHSAVWIDERKKRITSSNFAAVVKRNPSLPVKNLVKALLYSSFRGDANTSTGLNEEKMTIKEYVDRKAEDNDKVEVYATGLLISRQQKFLAASPDGKVICENGDTGLIEVKNLLHKKPINLHEGVKQVKNFCLEHIGNTKQLRLKRNHGYYYQVQGQLNIANLPWVDFVVRTKNPYQLHVERIVVDQNFWQQTMVSKLESFYHQAVLPELASPRFNTVSGIREPGKWVRHLARWYIIYPRRRKEKGK